MASRGRWQPLLAVTGVAVASFSGWLPWRAICGGGVLLALSALGLLYSQQERILYQPYAIPNCMRPEQNPPGFRSPQEYGLPAEELQLNTPDGEQLHAWLVRFEDAQQRKFAQTILFCHANAGNAGFRLPNVAAMHRKLGVNILLLEYRGYGASTGTASEEGLYTDGETAFRYLLQRPDLDEKKIFVFGRSLGGGVAVKVAEMFGSQCCGVIVENTFTSVHDMAIAMFPFLKFMPLRNILLRMYWKTDERIRNIRSPILFVSGALDEIVPPAHMAKLYEFAVCARFKRFFVVSNGFHNDTWQKGGDTYMNELQKFLSTASGC